MNNAFYRTESGNIVDLCKICTIEKWNPVTYRIFLTHNVYIDISEEDYVRINNYLANWNNSVYFKKL